MTEKIEKYDRSRVHVRGVFWFIAGFIVVVGGLLGLVWILERAWAGGRAAPSPLQALEVQQPLQPSPGHERLPWQDLAALRQRQSRVLNSYGLTGTGGPMRIPIERAMELLIEGGELNKPWINPAIPPYQIETQPAPRIKPSVENRS